MTGRVALHQARPIAISHGEGCLLFGQDGKRYIDFASGWCVGNIGWKNPEVKQAILAEAERGTYVPPFLTFPPWDEFAALLTDISPGERLTRAIPCTSGSEAVEFAIKCARAFTGKKMIASIGGVYHGHTYGAASVGRSCTETMGPCVPGFLKLPMPNAYHGIAASAVLRNFTELLRREEGIAAFLTEPVWTNAGSIIPPPDFLPAIEKLCRDHGSLFIMDEVATGFGRCGALFASELWKLTPDILCLGKGFTGGYATMGATLITEEIFQTTEHLPMYSTFGWLQADFAATRANVAVILRDKLWENAKEVGAFLLSELKDLEKLSFVGEVRGIGLLLGIEIVRDKESKAPDVEKAEALVEACIERGLILETAGNTLFITPPLILTKELAMEGAEILKEVLGKA